MRLSKNRFAGFYSPQNEFCGGPILFDRLWSPELRAPAPYAALAARPRRAVAPACGPVSPNFCENLAGYGVFSRHMSVKKHSIGKSLQFCSLFRQAERDAKGRLFFFCFLQRPYKPGSVVGSHLSWADIAVRLFATRLEIGRASRSPQVGVASDRVYRMPRSPGTPVGSYPTFPPFPRRGAG